MSFFSGLVKGLVGSIPIVGPALSGAIGGYEADRTAGKAADAQNATNQQNVALAREQMDFNAQQAQLNRDFQSGQQLNSQQYNSAQAAESRQWQENMSNTQYQRAVGDMEAAGINPMLAVSQGGAGTPSGATASAGMASGSQASAGGLARVESALAAGINTAYQAKQVENADKQGMLIDAQRQKTEVDTIQSTASTAEIRQRTSKMVDEIREIDTRINKQIAETSESWQRTQLIAAQEKLANAQRMLTYQTGSLQEAQRAFNEAQTILLKLEQPRAKNIAEMESSTWGAARHYLPDTGSIINSAGSVLRMLPR